MNKQIQPPSLVCLGNFTVDDVYLPDGSFIPYSMGGDALYSALGARLWNPSVELMAPLSYDFPDSTYNAILSAGFNTQYLPKRDAPTVRNRVYYDAQGGRRWELLTSEEDFSILSPMPEDLPAHYLQTQAFLVLGMPLQAQENLVYWLHDHSPALVALDTQESYTFVPGNQERVLRMLPFVDIFLPSTTEVLNLVGHSDWLEAARQFAAQGPKIVVIKRGPDGVLVYERETGAWFTQPAIPVKVVDTTGAGDAFCGGFMGAYLEDPQNLRRAALAGVISASYAVSSFGMQALLDARPDDTVQYMK